MRRFSRHRQVIRDLVRSSSGPLAAIEVRQLLKGSSIGMATIYRHLNQGVEDGVLVRVELPHGPARYESADRPQHHHFECEVCKRVFDVMGGLSHLDDMVPPGFTLESHDLLLHARCRDCAENTTADQADG